jgi:hypothetical protein
MHETYSFATKALTSLQFSLAELGSIGSVELGPVRSVYVTGSYVRGDWLHSSSDLDITVLFREGFTSDKRDQALSSIKRLAAQTPDQHGFPSHCPSGGIDWGTQMFVPARQIDLRQIGPYLPYGVFFFDFRKHLEIIWGEDFRPALPEPLSVRELALPTIDWMASMASSTKGLLDESHRMAFRAYNALQLAQLVFGEETLDKRKMLYLYGEHVPDFPGKHLGEYCIGQYVGSVYPDRAPTYLSPAVYMQFILAVQNLLRTHC